MTTIIASAREKVRSGLATWSFIFAQIGGLMAAFSPLGSPVRALAGIITPYLAPALTIVLLIICLGDWASDAVPNRKAVYTAMTWPSALYATFDGKFGDKIFGAIRWASHKTGDWGQNWQAKADGFFHVSAEAKTAFTVFGFIFLAAGVVYAQRYAKTSKKTSAMGGRA